MRKLTDIELQTIKDRLVSLQITYLEIYDELLDHYISALEQVDPEDFDDKKEKLDEEFAWSVVRGMEKDLLNYDHFPDVGFHKDILSCLPFPTQAFFV